MSPTAEPSSSPKIHAPRRERSAGRLPSRVPDADRRAGSFTALWTWNGVEAPLVIIRKSEIAGRAEG